MVQRVQEGGVANFTILRAGPANFITTVKYRFEYGDASPGDFTPLSNDSMLVFDFGEWMKNISVAVVDDNIPETDEPFYIVLFNTTGLSHPQLSINNRFRAFYVAKFWSLSTCIDFWFVLHYFWVTSFASPSNPQLLIVCFARLASFNSHSVRQIMLFSSAL